MKGVRCSALNSRPSGSLRVAVSCSCRDPRPAATTNKGKRDGGYPQCMPQSRKWTKTGRDPTFRAGGMPSDFLCRGKQPRGMCGNWRRARQGGIPAYHILPQGVSREDKFREAGLCWGGGGERARDRGGQVRKRGKQRVRYE